MNTIRNRFLLTTAVLLAGVSLASAQGMREGGGGGMSAGSGPGAGAEHGRSGGAMPQSAGDASHTEGMTQGRAGSRAEEGSSALPSRAEHGAGMRDSERAADKADKGEHQTIGQGRGDRDTARQSQSQEKLGKDQTVGQSKSDRDQARQSRSESDKSSQKDKDKTVGQSRGDRDSTRQSQGTEHNKDAAQKKDANTTTGAKDNAQGKNAQSQSTTTTGANTKSNDLQGRNAQQGQGTTTGANTQGQANAPAQVGTQSSGQAQAQTGATQSMSGRVQVSAQQQTTLQQSVLSSQNVDRVRLNANSISFQVNAGVVVPRNISVISIADYPALIDIYPAYREDSFFVVDDEIVVTDRSRRIVDVIPAGPRTHFARRGSAGSGGSVAALDLSPDEIRIVQRVLIERHLLSGEADGVLGSDTRAALVTFQRQQGFEATGTIDTRTVAALGVSNNIRATQGQSTTVGQSGNNQPMQQNTSSQSNAPAQQNQTTGQAPQNQLSTGGQAQQNQPSTGGQAQQNQPANSSGQVATQPPAGQTTGQAPAQGSNQSSSQGTNQPSANPPSANQSTQSGRTNQNNAPASSGSQRQK